MEGKRFAKCKGMKKTPIKDYKKVKNSFMNMS